MPHEAPTNETDQEPYGEQNPQKPMSEPGNMQPPTGEDDMPSPLDVGKGDKDPNEVLQQLGANAPYKPSI